MATKNSDAVRHALPLGRERWERTCPCPCGCNELMTAYELTDLFTYCHHCTTGCLFDFKKPETVPLRG